MKHLGLDWGSRRIGVALSDPDGSIAFPHATLDATKPAEAVAALCDLVARERVGLVVVGAPVRLDGTTGRSAREAQRFADRLERALPVPLARWDERFTTRAAERAMRDAGASARARREGIDAAAAAMVLQSFLDARTVSRADDA